MSKTHHLKIDPLYYSDVLSGDKPFEVRKDDRGYRVGDTLVLQEYCRQTGRYAGRYTGRECIREVTSILRDTQGSWLAPGHVVLGFGFGKILKAGNALAFSANTSGSNTGGGRDEHLMDAVARWQDASAQLNQTEDYFASSEAGRDPHQPRTPPLE